MTVQEHPAAPSEPEIADPELEEELHAERRLARAIIIGVVIAVPINVGVWMGLVGFAVSRAGASLAGPLAMAAGVGVLSGLFFGTWAAFVATTHAFEEFDRKAASGGAAQAPQRPSPR